ncbi:hypothetical protein [Nocardia brasiliensis]
MVHRTWSAGKSATQLEPARRSLRRFAETLVTGFEEAVGVRPANFDVHLPLAEVRSVGDLLAERADHLRDLIGRSVRGKHDDHRERVAGVGGDLVDARQPAEHVLRFGRLLDQGCPPAGKGEIHCAITGTGRGEDPDHGYHHPTEPVAFPLVRAEHPPRHRQCDGDADEDHGH